MAYRKSIIDKNLKGITHFKRLPCLENFKIEMGVAGSIFEPHPPNFGKSDIF